MTTTLVVNGVSHEVEAPPDRPLLAVLRDDLGITGPKFGCGEAVCGACVVRVGDQALPACRTPLAEVAGRPVTTVEGLAGDSRLHPVQRAWLEEGALQCGFCTPGWLVETALLVDRTPPPSEAEVLAALERHLCRCCTYPRIRRAVRRALALVRVGGPVPGEDTSAPPPDPSGDGVPGQGSVLEAPDASPAGEVLDAGPEAEQSFFDALGDGLAVIADPPPGRRGWGPPTGAWVHVAAAGGVTCGIGKVEGGQGTRAALGLLVAEELGVPAGSVRLVMGDTAVSPYDMGTFGSRSMPDAGPALRRAAAAARESLREAAADRLGVGADEVRLERGEAWVSGARRVSVAELLRGLRRVEHAPAGAALTPRAEWRTAGRPSHSPAAVAAVLGRKRFPSDLGLPGMLHGAVLRPPAYGARLASLDTRGAEAMEGVTVVRDGDFVGVAASDRVAARTAIQAIRAVWEQSPQPSRSSIEAHLRSHPTTGEGWDGPHQAAGGDVAGALAGAATRWAATYVTAYIAHVPLEPRSALAEWRDGRLTVWTGTQTPFMGRHQLAEAVGLEEDEVRLVVPDFGGGFGGKHGARVAIEAARLARAAGRPVKLQWSRAEEFTWGHLRPAAVIDVAAGVGGDGRLCAWTMTNINSGPAGLGTPYAIANWRVEYQPAASPLPQGSYRALAATANHFARESAMDELAGRAGADPLGFRLRHLADERLAEVFRTAAARIGWGGDRPPGHGRGIAGGIEKDGRVATAAEVVVEPDRTLRLLRLVTAFDCGTVVDPDNLANQVEGAACMGLGGALFEAIDFADGRLLNASLSAYRVPRVSDVPEVEAILIDRPDQPPAGGGETPIVGVAPAIANAIADACGVRLRSLPLAPDGRVAEG
jgi:nicotinate dehydrogenase subunit B